MTKDHIFDARQLTTRRVEVGKVGVCSLPDEVETKFIEKYEGRVFVRTGYSEWLWLRNRKTYTVEFEGMEHQVWICMVLTREKLKETTKRKIPKDPKESLPTIRLLNARCNRSMKLLDQIHRDYIQKRKYRKNEIVAVKSVAGSGKTTTLLSLAKKHHKKKILYVAFNKNLITEIGNRVAKDKITNLVPRTFDSLIRKIYIDRTEEEPYIEDLRPHNLGKIVPWFSKSFYKVKMFYIRKFAQFCQQLEYDDVDKWSREVLGKEKPLLKAIWDKVYAREFQTFDSMRKLAHMNEWCKGWIDSHYDMIFVDEAQDFDHVMLEILVKHTTIPKVFVGDPLQAIYEWRGCINAFDQLPPQALTIEFYSTFRIGNPACKKISQQFDNCWMISRCDRNTQLKYGKEPKGEYVYLFRSWKGLLQTAQTIDDVWIYGYDKQVEIIKKLHEKLQKATLTEDEKAEFSDDLPAFLIKLTHDELDKILTDIKKHLVSKELSEIQMYTIHSYKGLESDTIRVFNDIKATETNLRYVALTRGKEQIIVDEGEAEDDQKVTKKPKKKSVKKKANKSNKPKTLRVSKTDWVKEFDDLKRELGEE